jgi:CBS domain-containing protein
MRTIRQILEQKGYEVLTIDPGASVYSAIEIMAENGIGALMVMEDNRPMGLISERDYARKVILKGRSSKDTEVREVMTTHVYCVHPEQTVEESMALMTEKRVRHLPVTEDGHLLGIVSIGDLVKTIIAEQQFIIEQLEHYICG